MFPRQKSSVVPRLGVVRGDIHDGVQFVHVVGVQKDAILDDLSHHHLEPTSQSSCAMAMAGQNVQNALNVPWPSCYNWLVHWGYIYNI